MGKNSSKQTRPNIPIFVECIEKGMNGMIYKATNKINGKCYVGQTTQSLDRRKSSHQICALNGKGYVFHSAIRKHGFENFDWEVLQVVEDDFDIKSLLNESEKIHILREKSSVDLNGYNLREGGNDHPLHYSTKIKMSLAERSRYPRGPAHGNYGKPKSVQHRKKIGNSNKGKPKRSPSDEERIARRKCIDEGELIKRYNGLERLEDIAGVFGVDKRTITSRIQELKKAGKVSNRNPKILSESTRERLTSAARRNAKKREFKIEEGILIEMFNRGSSRAQMADYFLVKTHVIKRRLRKMRAEGKLPPSANYKRSLSTHG